MQGLLNAGAEVFQFQLTVSAVLAALVLWLALRMYRRMRSDRASTLDAQRATSQAVRIAELTAALAQARTPAAAIEAAIIEPLHALKAHSGVMFLISSDGSRVEPTRGVGYPEGQDAGSTLVADNAIIADAVGRGAAVVMEQPRGLLAVPLLIGSRAVAVAQFDFDGPRTFGEADRAYVEALATRAAQALDRTREYEYAVRARAESETQRARADQEIAEREKIEVALRASEARGRALAARTSRLHGLTASLSESVTLDAVARAVVQQGRVAVGATAAEVRMLVDGGAAFETISAEGGDLRIGDRSPLEPGWCGTDAVDDREPIFISSFDEWQERYPKSASIAADGGYVSAATVPLLVEGRPIGVLAFYFTAPVNFDDEYRALLISVAQDCAQALDRARLYEAAQTARAEAETANRLKDEFVSIVSHELRSPLNAILGWSAMLQRGPLEPALTSRALQSVHDNATRQARLIDELLDFSRVSAGRFALVHEDIDIRDLIRGVVEAIVPETVDKGITLELMQVPPLKVSGDLQRLEQVFFNLLGNAIKFTPKGGSITIDVARSNGSVEVRVTDTGAGIDQEFLPFVFDRFRQGTDGGGREHGGLGLGLSIARQLVEAHKGSIRVESAGKGQGSSFVVTLPVAPTRPEIPEAALAG